MVMVYRMVLVYRIPHSRPSGLRIAESDFLRAQGNSCFVNAVMQCITYTRPLTTAFLMHDEHDKACTLCP